MGNLSYKVFNLQIALFELLNLQFCFASTFLNNGMTSKLFNICTKNEDLENNHYLKIISHPK